MPNFIYNNTALPIDKIDFGPLPPGANPRQWGVAAEWITVLQALYDVQAFCRGADWLGFTMYAVDPVPAGIANYLWMKSDGTLWKTIGGVAAQVGGGGGGGGVDVVEVTDLIISQPLALAITPDGAFIYMSESGPVGNEVSLIRTIDRKNIKTILAGMYCYTIKIDSAGLYVYAVSYTDLSVVVIDVSTNLVVATIPLTATAPYLAVLRPDNAFLFVLDSAGTQILVIDTGSNTVSTAIPVSGTTDCAFIASPDGLWLFASGGATYEKVDTGTNVVTTVTTPASFMSGFGVLPNSAAVYLCDSPGTSVYKFSTTTDLQLGPPITVGTSPQWLVVSPNGQRVYVLNGTPDISVINTATDLVIATVPLTTYAATYGLLVSPDSARVYAFTYNGFVDVIRTSDNVVIATITLSGSATGTAFSVSPDSAFLYVATASNLVDVYSTVTNTLVATVPTISEYEVSLGTFTALEFKGFTLTPEGGDVLIEVAPGAVVFDSAAGKVNIRSNRLGIQAPNEPAATGITNFGSGAGGVFDHYSTLSGGEDNAVNYPHSVCGGGFSNTVNDAYAVIGGGEGNYVNYDHSVIGGGQENDIENAYATIGGGRSNLIGFDTGLGDYSTIGGGFQNDIEDAYATIGGGSDNKIPALISSGYYSTIGGGRNNLIEDQYAFIGGGLNNTINIENNGAYGVIVGGKEHTIDSDYGFIGGGEGHSIYGQYSVIVGGFTNTISNGDRATICGGENNGAGDYAFVGGGSNNNAAGLGSTISGGSENLIPSYASYGTIPGGRVNQVDADDGTAMGHLARANRRGELTHSSGPGGSDSPDLGASQHGVIHFTGFVPGLGAGESVNLTYGVGNEEFAVGAYRSYTFVLTVIAHGRSPSPAVQSFRQTFSVRADNTATATIAAAGVLEQLGDVSAASWTITASAVSSAFRLTFNSGLTTTFVRITAKLEWAEIYVEPLV